MKRKIIQDYLNKINEETIATTSAGISTRVDNFPQFEPDEKKNRKEKKGIVKQMAIENEKILIEQDEPLYRAMIDLDGTIHKYSKGFMDGTLYDPPFPGAKETIDWLKSQGYEIVIFTTRVSPEHCAVLGQDLDQQMNEITNWLNKYEIYYDKITADKIAADFYIDDRAIPIINGNWNDVKKQIIKQQQK